MQIKNMVELFSLLPQNERIIVDVLRQIVLDTVPGIKEKISYNVPYFYRNKGICIIWPATIPRGGISSGVLLGFWQGNQLSDAGNYLTRGTNKKVFYRIFQQPEDIDDEPIIQLLVEAASLDRRFR